MYGLNARKRYLLDRLKALVTFPASAIGVGLGQAVEKRLRARQ